MDPGRRSPNNPAMTTAKGTAWAAFWDERGRTYPDDDPLGIDGWDYGISYMGVEAVDELCRQAAAALALDSASSLLEAGCGAGMFLTRLQGHVRLAVGNDLSLPMLLRARRVDRHLQVQAAEASRLPYRAGQFDAVLLYSVMHYFPSYAYANRVLQELYRVCRAGGRIWIGDVPDRALRDQALQHRQRLMNENVPKWRWPEVGPLEHRFYQRDFFAEFAQATGSHYQISPQSVPGYIQGRYRFSVLIRKR